MGEVTEDKCPQCGAKLEDKEFRSIAFPFARPFIRSVCPKCEWYGGVKQGGEQIRKGGV